MPSKKKPAKTKDKPKEIALTDLEVKNEAAVRGGSTTTSGETKKLRGGWDGN